MIVQRHRRPGSVSQRNVLIPASSDASVTDVQDRALFQVREKLMGRQEKCSALIISASTLSRTIMSTQMQSRGWTTYMVNHLAEGTSLLHQQISKAADKGFNVSREADWGSIGPQYTEGGARIKYADADAVVRMVLVDCFTHEPLEDIVKNIRLLDDKHHLRLVLVYLMMPRPPAGQGYILFPKHSLTLAEAYKAGVDLAIPTHFDRTVTEFLTEVFLSSSGRYLKSGATTATTSNFSQIRSLLLDITDRSRNTHGLLPELHATDDVTGGVPNLQGFAVASQKKGIDEDQLEDEVQQARQREAVKRQEKMQQRLAANAIDTNPEYISLLSKYEMCLRQLSVYKDKITDLSGQVENHVATERRLEEELTAAKVEAERQRLLVESLREQEEQQQSQRPPGAGQGYYAQLVQREQRIATLEKEATGFRQKYESSKKLTDEAISKVEKFRKEAEDAKKHIQNITKRFENKLRTLGASGAIDLESEVDKQDDAIRNLQKHVAKWKSRERKLRMRLEMEEVHQLSLHDSDMFGRTGNAIIGGFNAIMTKSDLASLLNQRKAQLYSTPRTAAIAPPSAPGSATQDSLELRSREEQHLQVPSRTIVPRGSDGQVSVVSVDDDLNTSVLDPDRFPLDKNPTKRNDPAFLNFFGEVNASQFDDMSAPQTADDKASRELCDLLVKEARSAIKEGDALITEVQQHQKDVNDARRYQKVTTLGLNQLRSAGGNDFGVGQQNNTLSDAALQSINEKGRLQAEHAAKELQAASDRIANELEGLMEAVETAEKRDDAQRITTEASLHDLAQLIHKPATLAYEDTLEKLRVYVSEQVRSKEDAVQHAKKPDDVEAAVTELARWSIILAEVTDRMSEVRKAREPGSQANKEREELERRLDVLESKATRQIPDLVQHRKIDAYLRTKQEMFQIQKQLRQLPGGRIRSKAQLPATQALLDIMRGQDAKLTPATEALQNVNALKTASSTNPDELPLSLLDLAHSSLKAEIESTRGIGREVTSNIQRRSFALGDEISLWTVAAAAAKAKPAASPSTFSPATTTSFGGRLREDSASEGPSGSGGTTMAGIASDMMRRFRSQSVVKTTAAASHGNSGGNALRNLVAGLKDAVTSRIEAAQENVHLLQQHVTDEVGTLLQDVKTFNELDMRPVESLLERTKDYSVPTFVYQLVLVYHKELVRLLKQLRRRTSLTQVNIIDAHQLQRQLLKEGKALTKAQVENVPFIMSVDAAQVSRFADYFEHETEALVKEGISRLQRYIDESAAKQLGVDPIPRAAAEPTLSATIHRGGHRDGRSPLSDVGREDAAERRVSGADYDFTTLNVRRTSSLGPQSSPGEGSICLEIPDTVLNGHPAHKEIGQNLVDEALTSTTEVAAMPSSDPLNTPRLKPDAVRRSVEPLLLNQNVDVGLDSVQPPSMILRQGRHASPTRQIYSRGGNPAGMTALSQLSFGAPPEDLDEFSKIIYVPRTPSIGFKAGAGPRRHVAVDEDARTQKVKGMDKIISQLMPRGGPVSLPHLPQWAPHVPPPSRQKALGNTANSGTR